MTNGPILARFELCGKDKDGQDVCTGMGVLETGEGNLPRKIIAKNISSNFKLKIKVISADWVDFDKLCIYINTPNTAAESGSRIATYPTCQIEKDILPMTVTQVVQLKNGKTLVFEKKEWEGEITFDQGSDFWLVVRVYCKKCKKETNPMFPVVVKEHLPILISNPIYVDVDGDGEFNPPPPEYGSASPVVPKIHNH